MKRSEKEIKLDEKIGFGCSLKNMFVGVVKPETYMKNGQSGKTWHAVMVVLGMSIILYLFTFWLPYNKLFGNGRLARTVDEAVKDFALSNDGFYYEGRYQWSDDENMTYILVDTSIKDSSAKEIESLRKENVYTTVFVVTGAEILSMENGRMSTIKAKDLYEALNEVYHASSFGKQDILDIINKWDTPVLTALYIGNVIGGIIKTFWVSFIVAIVGLIVSSALKLKVSLGAVYRAALYIRSLWYPILLLISTYVWPAKKTLMTLTFMICAAYMFIAIYRYNAQNPGELRGKATMLSGSQQPNL